MKIKPYVALFSVLIPLASHDTRAAPMGTTFTYQGRLTEVDAPANGLYDFSFVLHTNAVAAGSMVGAPVFTNAVAVSNGLVTVMLDFGAEVFAGEARWLEVGVRTNGAGQFVTLSPRQLLTATPYALYAPSAGTAGTAGNFTGSLEGDVTGSQKATLVSGIRGTQVSPIVPAADQLLRYDGSQWAPGAVALATDVTGTLADARLSTNVALLNAHQTFTGSNALNGVVIGTNTANQFAGSFTGDGSGLINLSPTNLTAGTARIDISGNASTATSAADFSGPLAGDVTGTQSATVVSGVGGHSAANVAGSVNAVNAATSANTPNTLVKRDGSGGFSAGSLTATSLAGDGSGLTGLNASALAGGTVGDARLSPNVALLNRNQTFTANPTFMGTNFFGNGSSIDQGRIIVNNGWAGRVDTNKFSGLGLQYDNTFGEGALLSSFDNGFGYLSFYTKAGVSNPITKQMIISHCGDVAVDQADSNNGVINNGTLAGAGLTFGRGSGEGIASKRTAGGNQYGLDFYTLFANRMSILQNGNVGIGTTAPGDKLEVAGAVRLDDNPLYLRAAGDPNHGLAFKDTVAGIWFDGPFLWGYNGGALGTVGPDAVSLRWYYNGDVWISNHCSVASLRTRNASAGIGRDPGTNALEVEGSASKTVAGGWLANSDARIKTDVHTVTNALDKLAQVRLVQFRYTDAYRAAHPSVGDREYMNVIAQEFQQVFPEAVQCSGEKLPSGDDLLQVDTYPLTIYSAAAIQALNQKVEAENSKLKQELGELRQLVNQLSARLNESANVPDTGIAKSGRMPRR